MRAGMLRGRCTQNTNIHTYMHTRTHTYTQHGTHTHTYTGNHTMPCAPCAYDAWIGMNTYNGNHTMPCAHTHTPKITLCPVHTHIHRKSHYALCTHTYTENHTMPCAHTHTPEITLCPVHTHIQRKSHYADRKSTRLNSSHLYSSRMPSSA